MSRRNGGTRVVLAVGLIATACALPHDMERAVPVGPRCPVTRAARPPAPGDQLVWYRAADPRDVELGARWCATVGPAVVDPLPAEQSAAWTADESLEVLSWNMWIGGGDLYRLLQGELGLDCSVDPAIGPPVRPFVLLLQEVWRHSDDLPEVRPSRIIPWPIDPGRTEGEDPDIVEAGRRCGLSLVYVPSARNGSDLRSRPREDKGNAILSNLPLKNPIAFDLPLEGGRKVAVAATVDVPGGRSLRVVSLHLDVASTLVRTVFSGNQTRVRQAMGLVDGLARAEADGYGVDATVVGADMNTWAESESALKRMHLAFPDSPEWDGLGTRAGIPTDHMFFRAADGSGLGWTDYQRIENRYSSDHHPRRLFVSPDVSP